MFIPINVEPGKNYYVEIDAQPSDAATMGGAAGYLLGTFKSNVHLFCGGGWCAAIEDADTANAKLKKMHVKDRS